MYTQCPNCDTQFRISIPQLKTAQGKVRCGHCENVFNALLNLSEQAQEIPTISERADHHGEQAIADAPPTAQKLPPAQSDAPRPLPSTNEAITAKPAAANPDFTFTTDAPEEPLSASPEAMQTSEINESINTHNVEARADIPFNSQPSAIEFEPLPSLNEFSPQDDKARELVISAPRKSADRLRRESLAGTIPPIFVSDRRILPRLPQKEVMDYTELEDYPPAAKQTFNWWGTVAWTFSILILLAVLLTQYIYFMRANLAAYPTLRPSLEKFCAVVSTLVECELPLRRDLSQIEKQDSVVKPHPSVADALQVNITLTNKAGFPQPYPHLQLTLSGRDGAVIAKRRFHPNEYLPANTAVKGGMQPGGGVPVTLELATPSTDFKLESWSIDLF
ncbi:MAG: DUF3426 domain-containing protein [Gammaproteobacteria bacterium]